ncbi:hypothetical protein DES53_102515 [Roseimicrobium gellanilyticum]|uniref:DUF1559 domain-containing protein n=1 Tax=Roseimicrobium gellanilyticum TaxID=748857 RepID=A0A366HS91_9BACT|nr:hypothetical protein [Roseimicrobium gellanilyticum]RBP46129.1 hypothetical protein DES53_102515 [Roseimicrobium gellanilyticum]
MQGRSRFTKVEYGVGLLAVTLLGTVACDRISERSQITKGISNCRQILVALRIYASDHNGKYPDAHINGTKTANAAFRQLFEEQILDNEAIFGCPPSPFEPDGKIEDAYIGPQSTKYGKAVQAGENHWAMTAGLNDSSAGAIPVVYENPVNATWPPKWNADVEEKPVRGRTWKNNTVIIGTNDTAVASQPMAAKSGAAVGLKPDASSGKDAFEAAINPTTFPKGEVLDVE